LPQVLKSSSPQSLKAFLSSLFDSDCFAAFVGAGVDF
jgi:hypothetical protein